LHAVAIRDIFDKKNPQKIMRFFLYGFPKPRVNLFNQWMVVPKPQTPKIPNLWPCREPSEGSVLAEGKLLQSCCQLCMGQRTADWFTLRTFHLTATMASQVLGGSYDGKNDGEVLTALLKSWFNRSRSTTNMVIGTKNEDAVLMAFSKLPHVLHIWSVGLLENKHYPWLAASPDAIAILQHPDGRTPVCVVEVKTRTTETTIQVAEVLAEKYKTDDGVIWAEVEDDAWKELVPKDHSDQVILQMIVSGCISCCYLCSRPGTERQKGRILYQVVAKISQELMTDKLRKLYTTTKGILEPFFISDNVDALCRQLPPNLSNSDLEVIKTRWPFFQKFRNTTLPIRDCGMVPINLFKSSYQSLYNSLKGGLDANTQQYVSIQPNVSVTFEQKYLLRMLLAGVTNAWRAFQLMHLELDENTDWTYTNVRNKVRKSDHKLKRFMHQLGLSFIKSASHNYAGSDYVLQPDDLRRTAARERSTVAETLGFDPDPNTLQQRLNNEVWPTRGKVKAFTQNPTFVELRFTKNDSFQHVCRKATEVPGKHHCALCYHRQSKFGCSTCKVLLCRTNLGNLDSCFSIWHSKRDLVAERKSFSTYHNKQNTENLRRTTISSAEGNDAEVPTASLTRRKRKEPDGITVERRQKKNKASCDTSEENNTEAEDEGTEDEGVATPQPTPKRPPKSAAARASKPSPKATKPRANKPSPKARKPRANKPSANAKKPSRPVAKKIRSQGPSRKSATASKRKTTSL